MASLVLSDPLPASPDFMGPKKIKHRKYKKIDSMDVDLENGHSIEEQKSEKKEKIESNDKPASGVKKGKIKEKASDKEASDGGFDTTERENNKPEQKKKKKKKKKEKQIECESEPVSGEKKKTKKKASGKEASDIVSDAIDHVNSKEHASASSLENNTKKGASNGEAIDGCFDAIELVNSKELTNDSPSKKKRQKRKASDQGVSVSGSDETCHGEEKEFGDGSSVKKSKVVEEEKVENDESPNALSKFRISEPLQKMLKSRGIESLFPIQSMTFDMIFDGFDLVGRARTGQGKTLAFVLPILESLTDGPFKDSRKIDCGKTPSVLVLLPTRELAKQVHEEFELYGRAVGLSTCCVYGGAPMHEQENALMEGVDVIVGTPGRIKDFIERGTLELKLLKFRVLDEADEMLTMGFVEDVEFILGKVQDASKVQTLLFSATLPKWVNKISMRFLKNEKKTVDLVGNEKLKASASIRHLVIPCSRANWAQLIPDIIHCYSRGGRTIIFTEKRRSAAELARLLPGSRALHGEIWQGQREVILSGFRSGSFSVLVATNVAARGLDITDVQLIIQCEPPPEVESYIHRSGRTGRAGNTGVAVLLYEAKQSSSVYRIERESGVKFEHVSAPQAADVAESAGYVAAEAIVKVSDSMVPVFRERAELLMSSCGLPAVDILAKALAKVSGCTDIKKKSLLSCMDGQVTLLLRSGTSISSSSFVISIMRQFLPVEKLSSVKNVFITADCTGAVFDVPAEDVSLFLEGQGRAEVVSIEVLEQKLPPLREEKDDPRVAGKRWSGGRGGYSKKRGGGHGGKSFSRR